MTEQDLSEGTCRCLSINGERGKSGVLGAWICSCQVDMDSCYMQHDACVLSCHTHGFKQARLMTLQAVADVASAIRKLELLVIQFIRAIRVSPVGEV